MNDTVVADGGEGADCDTVDVPTNHAVIPDGGPLVDGDLTDDSCIWGNPIVVKPGHQVVQWESHAVLGLLVDHRELGFVRGLLGEPRILAGDK